MDGPTNRQMQPLIEMRWHIEKWFISKFGCFGNFKNFKIWCGGFGRVSGGHKWKLSLILHGGCFRGLYSIHFYTKRSFLTTFKKQSICLNSADKSFFSQCRTGILSSQILRPFVCKSSIVFGGNSTTVFKEGREARRKVLGWKLLD